MKKLLSLILAMTFIQSNVFATLQMEDLTSPKDSFYRLGTSDMPETKADYRIQPTVAPIVAPDKTKEIVETSKQNLTYADLSIKKMSLEVSKSIDIEFNQMQEDLSLLWQGAATKSDTIKFAIYKLSNPDKDKPDTGAVKKVLTTIAGMSTFLGAGMGNPVLASAALIGGNTLGIMSQDNKALNYKYSQVTDADMILLVRKVEDLQQKVVDLYYDYQTSRQLYNMASERVKKCHDTYSLAQNSSKEVVLIADTFYREAIDQQQTARGRFFEARSRLEQLVGVEIFRDFESIIDKRE